MSRASALAEQLLELGARLVDLGGVGWGVSARTRLEMIAEVRVRFVAHFLRRGLAAVLGDACVVVDAHPPYVHLSLALRALLPPPQPRREPGQRQCELRQ